MIRKIMRFYLVLCSLTAVFACSQVTDKDKAKLVGEWGIGIQV